MFDVKTPGHTQQWMQFSWYHDERTLWAFSLKRLVFLYSLSSDFLLLPLCFNNATRFCFFVFVLSVSMLEQAQIVWKIIRDVPCRNLEATFHFKMKHSQLNFQDFLCTIESESFLSREEKQSFFFLLSHCEIFAAFTDVVC